MSKISLSFINDLITIRDFTHRHRIDALRSLMQLPIIVVYVIMYTVYVAQLNKCNRANNAAGTRLYLVHIVAAAVIAVPSISLFLVIAIRKRMPKLVSNVHGNVSVSAN